MGNGANNFKALKNGATAQRPFTFWSRVLYRVTHWRYFGVTMGASDRQKRNYHLEGKSQKPRKITFHRNLQSIFKETKAALPALAHFAIFAPDSNPAGEPVSTTAANKRINNVFKRYGIATQNPSSHTLRKTFARRVFEASGKNDEALMLLCEILNHEHTAVTRRYIGLTAERIKNIYLNL